MPTSELSLLCILVLYDENCTPFYRKCTIYIFLLNQDLKLLTVTVTLKVITQEVGLNIPCFNCIICSTFVGEHSKAISLAIDIDQNCKKQFAQCFDTQQVQSDNLF